MKSNQNILSQFLCYFWSLQLCGNPKGCSLMFVQILWFFVLWAGSLWSSTPLICSTFHPLRKHLLFLPFISVKINIHIFPINLLAPVTVPGHCYLRYCLGGSDEHLRAGGLRCVWMVRLCLSARRAVNQSYSRWIRCPSEEMVPWSTTSRAFWWGTLPPFALVSCNWKNQQIDQHYQPRKKAKLWERWQMTYLLWSINTLLSQLYEINTSIFLSWIFRLLIRVFD